MRGRLKARKLDDEAWDDLEETLLLADIGVATTTSLLAGVRARARAEGLSDAEGLPTLLEAEIASQLDTHVGPRPAPRARATERVDPRRGERRREDDHRRQARDA